MLKKQRVVTLECIPIADVNEFLDLTNTSGSLWTSPEKKVLSGRRKKLNRNSSN